MNYATIALAKYKNWTKHFRVHRRLIDDSVDDRQSWPDCHFRLYCCCFFFNFIFPFINIQFFRKWHQFCEMDEKTFNKTVAFLFLFVFPFLELTMNELKREAITLPRVIMKNVQRNINWKIYLFFNFISKKKKTKENSISYHLKTFDHTN